MPRVVPGAVRGERESGQTVAADVVCNLFTLQLVLSSVKDYKLSPHTHI